MDKEFCITIFVSSLLFCIYYFLAKNILKQTKDIYFTTFCEFTLLGFVGLTGLLISKKYKLINIDISKQMITSAAILVIGCLFLNNLLINHDVNKIVSIRQILTIIITLLIAYFFLQEKITKINILGILFGIISIYLITIK